MNKLPLLNSAWHVHWYARMGAKKKLQAYLATQGLTMQDAINEAMEDWLRKRKLSIEVRP